MPILHSMRPLLRRRHLHGMQTYCAAGGHLDAEVQSLLGVALLLLRRIDRQRLQLEGGVAPTEKHGARGPTHALMGLATGDGIAWPAALQPTC